MIKNFVTWWAEAPLYQSVWFAPIILVLFVIALIRNGLKILFSGDKA